MIEAIRIDAPNGPIGPIQRITACLRSETETLRRFAPVDLDHGIQIKSQALLELTRQARLLAGTRPEPALGEALIGLRESLAENAAAVALHLDAARKVSALIVGALERDMSDLTYSNTPVRAAAYL